MSLLPEAKAPGYPRRSPRGLWVKRSSDAVPPPDRVSELARPEGSHILKWHFKESTTRLGGVGQSPEGVRDTVR